MFARWLIGINVLLIALAACTPPQPNLHITALAVDSPPVVVRVVTLHVQATSRTALPDARIEITLPEGIALSRGSLVWKGETVSNRPQSLRLSVCASRVGDWKIIVVARSQLSPSSSESDLQILNVRSATDHAEAIPSWDYSVWNWHTWWTPPTPGPVPVSVSAECLGEKLTSSHEWRSLTLSRFRHMISVLHRHRA